MVYLDGIEDYDESLVRNKSNFVPPKGREELLDNFVQSTINISLEPAEKSKVRRNINFSERKSITSLANDENIIIKQIDNNPQKETMKKYRSLLKEH